MSQYPASGVLFSNDRKQSERQPDYTGSIEIDQETVLDLYNQLNSGVANPKANLAGWRKTSKGGKNFLSLKAGILRERQDQGGYQRRNSAPAQTLDDEIPF